LDAVEDVSIPENVRKNAVYYLHGFIEQNKAKIIADLSTIDDATTQVMRKFLENSN
jgi:hypothetical protein